MTATRRDPTAARLEHEWVILDIARRLGRVTTDDVIAARERSLPWRTMERARVLAGSALLNIAASSHLRRAGRGIYRLTNTGWQRLAELDDDRAALACKHCARRRKAGFTGRCPACSGERVRAEMSVRRAPAPAPAVIETTVTVTHGRVWNADDPIDVTREVQSILALDKIPPGRYRVRLERIS